jgi:hypothetical protein
VPVLRPETSAASAAFTTRLGGESSGVFAELNLSFVVGDEDAIVRRNRETAGSAIGRGGKWAVTKQVHGPDVHRAEAGTLREGDALWTDSADDTLAVLSADCVLILLAGGDRLGVAHAGWRGLVAGVVEAAAARSQASELFAGPAIGPCCFEVGADVREAFERTYPAAVVDARHIDLWVATEEAGRRAGVERTDSVRICTSCHPELFFSHRRDRDRTGRQALIAHA